jgi:uncharacterized membrane protein YeiB
MLLIWDGDVLSLYAACGLSLLPFLRLPTAGLAATGVSVVALSFMIPMDGLWPTETELRAISAEASQA